MSIVERQLCQHNNVFDKKFNNNLVKFKKIVLYYNVNLAKNG